MKILVAWLIVTTIVCNAEFVLEDYGVQPFAPTSMALSFQAMVSNNGKPPTKGKIPPLRLEMIKCCHTIPGKEQEPDCESMQLRSGLFHRIKPGERKSLLTFFPNKHLINRIGFCTFRIHGDSSIKPFRIDFNTAQGYPHVHIKGVGKGPNPCKNLDEDPLRKCKPVNCIEKYIGYRSFYNAQIDSCEPTPFCVDPHMLGNDTLLHKEEHRPVLLLNPDTNKCVNATVYKRLNTRAIILLDDDELKMSTKTFASLYGITLAKLTVAFILTLIFMIVVCIVLKFCFCCLPCCTVFNESKQTTTKCGTKYMAIVNETDAAPDSATKIIKEIRDRREMPKRKDVPKQKSEPEVEEEESYQSVIYRNSHNSDTQNSSKNSSKSDTGDNSKNSSKSDTQNNSKHPSKPGSSNHSKNESPEGGNSAGRMGAPSGFSNDFNSLHDNPSYAPTASQTSRKGPSAQTLHSPPAASSNTGSIVTYRKLPNVAQLLHQVDSIREKKSEFNSRQGLRQDLERAFGRDMRFSRDGNNYVSYRGATSQPQEIPDPSSRILNLKDVPPVNHVIHKVQEPSRTDYVQRTSGNKASPRIDSRVSGFQHRHDAQENRQLEQRFYKEEMAKAASFLRELEQRRGDTAPIYFEKRPLLPDQASPLSNAPGQMDTNGSYGSVYPAKVKPQISSPASNPAEKTIRRIKDEAPIPLSMIYSKTKLNRMKAEEEADAIEMRETKLRQNEVPKTEETNNKKLSWDEQPDKVFETFQFPICSSTPKELPTSPASPTESIPASKVASTSSIPTNPFLDFEDKSNHKLSSLNSTDNFNFSPTKSPSAHSLTSGTDIGGYETEIPLQFQIPPDFKSKLAPFADTTIFTVPIPIKAKAKPSAVKFEEDIPSCSHSKAENSGCSNDDDFLRGGSSFKEGASEKVWSYTGRSNTIEEKFQIVKEINSQNLVHSPQHLSASETSIEGSECLESRNDPRSPCFFDDYLEPTRRPSNSDDILLQNRWIDNFRTE